MLSRIHTSSISGISARTVEVETRVRPGRSHFSIIGLGDGAIREARDRVESAIKQSGMLLPEQILVNLAPAELKKEGSGFDLAIAVGILSASRQIVNSHLSSYSFYGELSLDGALKPVRGIVALVIEAFQRGASEVIVPISNFQEASLIPEVQIVGVRSLAEVIAYLKGEYLPDQPRKTDGKRKRFFNKQLSDVRGQPVAKRAMLIAAAGGHNLLMVGPPGCGKSMLAERFPSLLPDLDREEVLEVVKIHSIAGLPITGFLSGDRPYRNPHHVISQSGLVGGGSIPRPGEISLAHKGVLFLDEFPEFRRSVLEALRAPLENGRVRVTRANASVEFPAGFQLVAAMNPCPCGRLGMKGNLCLCSTSEIKAYLNKLSQPILDRIDLHVDLDAVPFEEMTGQSRSAGGNNQELIEKVAQVRRIAKERGGVVNSALSNKGVSETAHVGKEALQTVERVSKKGNLSARGYFRLLKVSRTIADLDDSDKIERVHVAEAANYRSLDRIKSYCC